MTELLKAHIALFVAGLFFGANYWIAKGLMPDYLMPLQIIFLRTIGTSALFWIVQFFLKKDKISSKDMLRIAVASLFGITINQLFFFKGLYYTTPVDSSIIHATSPMAVMVLAALIIREKITFSRIMGIILGGVGTILLVTYGKEISFNSETFRGDVFILVNITAYSLYLVLIKPVMDKYNPISVMKWVFLYGFLFIIPFSIGSMDEIEWSKFNGSAWFALLYVVFITTFLTYLLTIYGLKRVSAGVVGFYIYLQPLVAAGLGILMFHEKLTWEKISAAALIFTGVYFVSRKSQKMTEGK